MELESVFEWEWGWASVMESGLGTESALVLELGYESRRWRVLGLEGCGE